MMHSDALIKSTNSTVSISLLAFCPSTCQSLQLFENTNCSMHNCSFLVSSHRSPILCHHSQIALHACSFPTSPSTPFSICTLVRTDGPNSHIFFHNAFFADLSLVDSEPFFAEFSSQNVSISQVHLQNISIGTPNNVRKVNSHANTSISHSSFHTSTEVLSNGIIRGICPSTSLFVVNTTFKFTTSGTEAQANLEPQNQVNTTGDASFQSSSWTDTSSEERGGAICADSVGSLSVSNCEFTRCSAKSKDSYHSGGAIFFNGSEIYAFTVESSLFYECHGERYGGSMVVGNSSAFSLKSSNFSFSTSNYTVPTVHLIISPSGSLLSQLRFEHARIVQEDESTDYPQCSGAIDLDGVTGTFYQSNLLFHNNSVKRGGAVLLSRISVGTIVTWFSCLFVDNTALDTAPDENTMEEMSFGNDIFVYFPDEEWNKTLAREDAFINTYSTSQNPKIVMRGSAGTLQSLISLFPNQTDLGTRLPSPQLSIDVISAADTPNCGIPLMEPCASLSFVVTSRVGIADAEISIEDGEYTELVSFEVKTGKVNVKGSNRESVVLKSPDIANWIQIAEDAEFSLTSLTINLCCHSQDTSSLVISNGTLLFSDIAFTCELYKSARNGVIFNILDGATTILNSRFETTKYRRFGAFAKINSQASLIFENTNMSKFDLDRDFLIVEGNITVKDCSFTKIAPAYSDDQFMCASALNGQIVVATSIFDALGSSKDGGAMGVVLSSDTSLSVTDTSFRDCWSYGYGGGLDIKITESGKLKLDNVTFYECRANVNGGGFKLDFSEMDSVSEIELIDLDFFYMRDNYFFLVDYNLQTRVNAAPFITFKPTITPNYLVSENERRIFTGAEPYGIHGSLLFFWYPHTSSSGAVHVHKDGEDHRLCGLIELPCSHLSSSFRKGYSTSTVIDSDLVFNENINDITSSHSITSTLEYTITVDNYAIFSVSSGTLSIQSCSFVSTDYQRTSSFLTLSGSGSATLTSCSFSMFRSTSAGSVVSGTLSSSCSLILDGCTFTSCVSNKKGGVIAVSLEGSGKIEMKNTNAFSSCWSETGEGNWMSITSVDLESFMSTGALTSIRPNSTNSALFGIEEKRRYFGVDTYRIEGSLLFFWYPHTSSSGAVHVHKDGEDHKLCGRIELPCSHLSSSFSKYYSTSTVIDSDLEFNEVISDIDSPQALSSTPEYTITVEKYAIFSVSSGTLSILTCSFVSTGIQRTSSFVTISGSGYATLTSCSFSSFHSTSAGSVVSGTFSSSYSLVVDRCTFTSCSTTENGGALNIRMSDDSSLSVSRSSFENCRADGFGGALFIDLMDLYSSYSHLSFSDVSFGSSSSNSAGEYGQNVFFAFNSYDIDYFRSAIRPLIPSYPSDGDVFSYTEWRLVEYGTRYSSYISYHGSVLALLHPIDSTVYVSDDNGNDHHDCGARFLPCKNLDFAFDSADRAQTNQPIILLQSDLTLDSYSAITSCDVVVTSENQHTLFCGSSAQINVYLQATLTFREITLQINSVLNSILFNNDNGSIFIEPSATISHDGTSFTPTHLSYPLMSVQRGSLSLQGTASSPHVLSFFTNYASSTCCLIHANPAASSDVSLFLSYCHFTDCRMMDGAVIMFSGRSGGEVRLTNCYFSRNEGYNTNDIVAEASWASLINSSSIVSCFSDSNLDHLVVGYVSDNDLLPFSVLGVNTVTNDDAVCQMPSIACSSVQAALSHCVQMERDGSPALRLIEMETDVSEASTLVIDSRRIRLISQSDRTLERTGSNSLLTVSTGYAGLRDFCLLDSMPSSSFPVLVLSSTGTLFIHHITFNFPASPVNHNLIHSEQGLVDFTLINVPNANLGSKSLIESNGGDVVGDEASFSLIDSSSTGHTIDTRIVSSGTTTLTYSHFQDCHSGEGGGAMKVTIVSGSLSIEKSSFERCSSGEDGGAVWIDASSTLDSFSIGLISVTFGRNSNENKCGESKHGPDVFVVGGRLEEIVEVQRWSGTFEVAPKWTLVGSDSTSGRVLDLTDLLQGSIWRTSEGGSDESGDGSLSSPFGTISRGLEEVMESSVSAGFLEVVGKVRIGKRVEMLEKGEEKTITLFGDGEESICVCGVEKDSEEEKELKRRETRIIVIRFHTLSLKDLSIWLTSGKGAVFEVVAKGKLLFESCRVEGEKNNQQEIKMSLVVAGKGGQITTTALSSTDLQLSGKGSLFVLLGASHVDMKGMSMDRVETEQGCVVGGEVRGELLITQSSFVRCGGRRFGSVVRLRGVGSRIVIRECVFSDCWTRVRMDEVGMGWNGEGVGVGEMEGGRGKGGGSVLVEIEGAWKGKRGIVDLSGSRFERLLVIISLFSHHQSVRLPLFDVFRVLAANPNESKNTTAIDVQKSISLETILQKKFHSETLHGPQLITLPNGSAFASNHYIHSTSLALNGMNHSTLHYHNDQHQTDFQSQEYLNPKQSHGKNHLFKIVNASFSVSDLTFDLRSESSNGDVACACITSSSIHITNCGFLWTGLHSLFVLHGSSLSTQSSSSITLVGCTLDPSEQRLAPIVEDIRAAGGSELFTLDLVATRIANTKVIGADGIGVAQPSQNGILSDFEGICTTLSEISFSNVSSLPGTVRPVSPLFSQRMIACGIWGSNNHLSGSTVRDMNGGGGFVCSNSSVNWCHTTSSERPSLSPHTPTLSSSLASPNTPDSPAEEGDDEDDQFTGKIHDGVARFTFTEGAITFTRCWFFNMQFSTTNMTDIGSGGSALSFQSGTAALTLTSCKFENCSVSSPFAKQIIFGGCVYICRVYADIETTAEATIDSCSFTNWSSPSDRPYQYGGCVGTMNSAHNLKILNSNMTQVLGTTKLNGGFISHYTCSEVGLTIDKCRLSGDGKTMGHCVNLTSLGRTVKPVSFSMTDTEIDNTNSTISLFNFTTNDSIDFIRVNMKNVSFYMDQVSAPHGPILFLDCVLDQTCRLTGTQSVSASFLYSGTTFTGAVTTNQVFHVRVSSPTRHLIFQQCIFTECSTVHQTIIQASSVSSLTVDSSTFTNCFGAHTLGLFGVVSTPFRAHSCTFTNISAQYSNILNGSPRQAFFFENCHFDLQPSNRNDFLLSDVGQMDILNESSIVGCTSNRPITANYNSTQVVCPFIKEVTSEPETNKMRVGTWLPEEGFSDHSSLSDALATLSDDSLLPNIVFLSEGSHLETSNLEIKHDVEIVGSGSNTTNFHFTELTTAGFKPKSGGKLRLRSMKLIPSTLSTTLVEMDEDVSLLLTRTFVDGVSGQTVSLMLLTLGTTRIAHSAFQNIMSERPLISVSGSASLTVSSTYFIAITRTSLPPSSTETTQCGSCVEGRTSGKVCIVFSRFGVCRTNGRAGAIDLEGAGDSSSVEMDWNTFDQNLSGVDINSSVKGNDVVVKACSESQLSLNLLTQHSFPTLHSFLINSAQPIVPPPDKFNLKANGIGGPLAWVDKNILNRDFLSGEMTLHFLLGSRLHNNTHTSITTDFEYQETMTPFTCQNSSVSVNLYRQNYSSITVEQTNETFCHLINSTLTLNQLTLSFHSLEASAFDVDSPSSLTLDIVTLSVTNPLKAPFVSSQGKSITVHSLKFAATLKLDNTPFIKAHSNQNESSFSYQSSNPSLATLASLDTPFISLEGVTYAYFYNLNIPGNLGTSIKVSLVKATNTNITFRYTQVSNLQTTANGLYLNADSCNVTLDSGTLRNISAGNGGFMYCTNSIITMKTPKCTNCSATKGGIVYAVNSDVSINGKATFTSCNAEEGGVAYLVSSTLQIAAATFTSNSAKRGGVAFIDLADDCFVSTASTTFATFTDNTATDLDENGVDCGKGGVFFITGTTTATNPLNFGKHHFDRNQAKFGNDVFVEESVLSNDGPTRLSNCGGESYSSFPHLEIENYNTTQDELDQISDFIPFPTLTITTNGTLTDSCKWSNGQCRTLIYALQYLQTTYPGGSLISRSARQGNTSMTTEPIVFVKQDLWYWTSYPARYNLSLTATHDSDEKTIFTIEDESRLKLERMNLILKSKHFAAKVTSEEGSLVMDNSTISCASVTTVSPIWSVGISVGLNNVTFQPSLRTSIATLSSPLVHFAPQPSEQDELRSESFEMTDSIFINLTFEGTTMIEVETTGDVTFTTRTFTDVVLNQQEGEYLTLKGKNFKTQLIPEQWDEDLQTKQHLTSLWGEDISMDDNEKWRRGSLVYWLVSPSSEVVIGLDDDAVDHPNCGSSTFKCTTLDSAFSSAGRNSIDTISFSVSTTLSSSLSVDSSLTFKSFSNAKQTITFDGSSSMTISTPMKTLTLTSLVFTVAELCSSATLFVVEKGEMKFSSCLIGSSDSSSPLVVPATTTKLIEVKADGTLTLIDTLIQHITFTHATHGTALHLHADSTNTFSGTSRVGEITSNGIGSHVVISSSAGLNSDSISSLASQIEPWGPSRPNGGRFTESEINEFVVMASTGEVEELIYRWHPYDALTLFVDRTGGSHSKCGLSSLPCSSLSSNLEKLGADQVIKVCTALDEAASITTERDLSILSSDTSNKQIRVSETCSFISIGFTLSFTSISFIPLPQSSNQNTEANTRSVSLFVVESGSLSLTACSCNSISSKHGGVLYSEDSNVNIKEGTFSNCAAEKGGVAYLVSSTLSVDESSFVSNSAKLGGVFWIDFGQDSSTSLSLQSSTFTTNSAHDMDENGVDCGKGGAIFVTGKTSSQTPIDLTSSHFDENTATFGNDVFVSASVLGDKGPDLLSECGGESYSRLPHLEIENRHEDNDELYRISNFLPFPTLNVGDSASSTLTPDCKWSDASCQTLEYALQFLQTAYQNQTMFPRQCSQCTDSLTTEPIILDKHDLVYSSSSLPESDPAKLILSVVEGIVFTINDASRLTVEWIQFSLTQLHQIVKVNFINGQFAMKNCLVLSESGKTTSRCPIISNGNSLILNTVSFSPTLTTSKATLSSPLVYFAPLPSEQDELGSGSFIIKDSIFINLTFEGTTMIEAKTTGDVTFTTPTFTNIISNQKKGKYLALKGQNFRTQLIPEQWDTSLKTAAHVASLWGEDISMEDNEKWRRGSLVYWLVSPSSEVVIGLDEDAVDHPNCGSSTFKCTTLDSAFSSAVLNTIDTISFSVSTTLSSSLSVDSSITLKSFSNAKQTITFDDFSSMIVNTSLKTLSLTSLIFTVAELCSSATLFVVEKGEMKFSSCLIGSSDSSSPLVVPATTTKLIEVKSDGTLTLIDTLIQHITFTHATLGTALHLHADSTNTFSGTSRVGEITSNGRGSHVVISSSAGLESTSISSLASQIQSWGPSRPNGGRFTESEINEFVVISSTEEVEELIYRWHPYDELTLFVDRTGGSHSKCGFSSLPCSSLSSNLAKLGTGQVIKVCSALDEAAEITTERDLSILSSDTSRKEVRVSETCSFTSKDFTLSFTSLSFVPLPKTSNQNAATTSRTDSLFVVESGSLSLTSCSVSSFELSSSPLITHTSGTLTLQSCSVSTITRSTGNGTILSIEMETGKSLLLDEIEFSSMSSSKDSPILALSFPPFDKSNPDPLFGFTLTKLDFKSMTGMATQPPCFISLVGDELASWIDEGDSRFKNSYGKDSELDHYWSYDQTIPPEVSLLFYLRASEGPVGVSNSGYDMAKCGSNSLWCSTIELSLTRLSAQNTKKIVVMDEVTLSSSIALPDELTFAGNPSALSTCVVSASGSFVSEDIDFTTISKLTFSLPSTQTAEAVIVHSSTKLTLSNLELSSQVKSSAVFLQMSSGSAEMNTIFINSEMETNSILVSILGGTVTASHFHVESGIAQNGTVLQVEGGSLSLTGMTATSSKPIEGRLLSVTNAALNVSDIKLSKQTFTNALLEFSSFEDSTINNMNISECSGSTIITAKDGDELTIRDSFFSSLTPPTALNEGDSSDLCGWEKSLIEIYNSPLHFHQTELSHIPQGAISISNAPLTLSGCTFSNNSPPSLEWPSRRRNIKCSNGTVGVNTIHGGDGHSSPHLWILTDECTVQKDSEIEHSSLFVPTLSNTSSSTFNNKQKEYTVTIVGTMMIPCGLSLEIFEQKPLSTSNEGTPLPFEISSLKPSKWTETELSFVLPQSSVAELNSKYELRCRLIFGDGQQTDSFSLTGKGKGKMSQGGLIASIVIPVVCVVVLAVILLIVILCILAKRRKQKEQVQQQKQELNLMPETYDNVKYDENEPFDTFKPIFAESGDRHNPSSLLMVSENQGQTQKEDFARVVPFGLVQNVEALRCDEKEGIVPIDPRNTLYHRLHVEKKVDFDKKQIAVQITQGLERMLSTSPFSEVFTRLSPHWIILNQANNIFLRMEDLPNKISQANHTATSQSKNVEDRRWNAPEQDTKEDGDASQVSIDRTKASVFRLGLVLWELETELVPFGELDAVNAARQVKAGVMPLIHNWEDESMADLVRDCLSLVPDDRPTLADVKSRLESLCSNTPIADCPQPDNGEVAASKLQSN
ncbi:hypothetical protein BLNAU_9733 [Blattamonas nauphoetae]|uniref:Protein kinase domain-containing protein n=1 Tax=Blattamonas nauphoetae TaxID=2049346 RepID=A0ABQ9XV52_9EUKA|nr:hypothetical protein BLNAU_9733 [Blattamonas nauphoetae]